MAYSIFAYALASVCFYGAFSRFTHGRFTPQWYAFQEHHAPDDGSFTAMITPVMDVVVGSGLLWPSTRPLAACAATLFLALGLAVQINAGKEYVADVALLGLGVTVSILELWVGLDESYGVLVQEA